MRRVITPYNGRGLGLVGSIGDTLYRDLLMASHPIAFKVCRIGKSSHAIRKRNGGYAGVLLSDKTQIRMDGRERSA